MPTMALIALKYVQRFTRVLGGWPTHVLYLCALAGSLVLLINMLMPISQGANQLVTETSADAIAPNAPFEQPTIVLPQRDCRGLTDPKTKNACVDPSQNKFRV